MVRRKGTSRVSSPGTGAGTGDSAPTAPSLPSLRQRRPVMFWVVIIAVVAMLLSVVASFVSALA